MARLARVDPELLYPGKHRGAHSQAHLALIHSRDALIRSRTQLINHVRGTVKSFGARLPKCSAQSFHKKVAGQLPDELAETLERRYGKKISARGVYRDPVRSTHQTFVKSSGLRWVCAMVLVEVP